MQPETLYVDVGGSQVAYQVIGEGPLDIVWASGWFQHVDGQWLNPIFAGFLKRLASFGRLITFDQRGSGASDPFPLGTIPTWEDWIDDLTAVLDAAGSQRAAIVALANAGPFSMLFAARFPERTSALVLVNSNARTLKAKGFPSGATEAERQAFVKGAVQAWGKDAFAKFAVPSRTDDPEFLEFWARYQRMVASPRRAEEQMQLLAQSDVRAALPLIRVPTLVMHRRGISMPFLRVEQGRYLAEHIPGARYVELDGEDVMPQLGEAEAIVDEIQEFLTGVRPEHAIDRILATVLFTDIVGSTQRAVELGDRRWRELLDLHDETVRRVVKDFRGRVVKHTGDGVMASFEGPNRAIRCADSLRKALVDRDVFIRSGIHTGEAEVRGDDLGGIAVHTAARVMSLAGPNEVLVTSTVRDLVAGSGIEFEDRGLHSLKGLPTDWQVLAVASIPS